MENLKNEEDFPFKKDYLYVRGTPPCEYLYVHTNDEEGADYLAYFQSHLSDTPVVYKFKKIDVSSQIAIKQSDFPNNIKCLKDIDKDEWKRARIMKSILPGSWIQLFRMIREEIIQNNK